MSDAKARAEARRQAILSRGSNRLAKLTSSARGDDYPAHFHDDPPLHVPRSRGTTPLPELESTRMESSLVDSSSPSLIPKLVPGFEASQLPDPFTTSMGSLGNPNLSEHSPLASSLEPNSQRTWPGILLRIISIILLVVFCVYRLEPMQYKSMEFHGLTPLTRNERWIPLLRMSSTAHGLQPVPFFWAFISLQLVSQTLNVYVNPISPPPSMLLDLALPFLPRFLALLVRNSLGYASMIGSLIDDIALSLVVMGIVVWSAGV